MLMNSVSPRRPASLPERYKAFLSQRIEEYKEQMPRHELLALGDRAIEQLRADDNAQLYLTEVVLRDHVDDSIRRALKLPSYRSWRNRFLKLRTAQRHPTHWGLTPDTPVVEFARQLGHGEVTVVIGLGASLHGFLMAAHDANVILVDSDMPSVEAAENRAAAEWLDSQIETLVVDLTHCPGEALASLVANVPYFNEQQCVGVVILDPLAFGRLNPRRRIDLIDALKDLTAAGGVHVMPSVRASTGEFVPLSPDALHTAYHDWETSRLGQNSRQRWFVAQRP